ncbi:MAG: TIGR02996 domain-containing protein [Deltaproteobacteria bacterium]
MARFEKGGQFVEYWTERPARPLDPATGRPQHAWPELLSRSGRIGASAETMSLALPHAFSADREYSRSTREQLEQGWRRVLDPAHEAALPDEPSDPSLDAQLRVDPGDADVALIYADWLQQHGHPRGRLIAVQAALRARPDAGELLDEQRALFEAHADVLLGPLSALVTGEEGDDPVIALDWDLGWIRSARIIGRSDEPADLVWEVLRHPSGKFLRSLVVGCVRSGDQDNSTIAATLMNAGPRPPLRELVIADFDDSEIDSIDISRAPIGKLAGLGKAYPELETVILKGTGDVALDGLALPRAKKFALRTSTMTKRTLATILAAPWPMLEDLELWFGDVDRGYGAECTVKEILPLFARPLPALRALRIMNSPFSDEVVPNLLAWPGAARLEILEFSLGTLSDSGARLLAASRKAFPALNRLGVFECALTAAGMATLGDAGYPVDATAISPAENWREPQQKPGRYCSVSE